MGDEMKSILTALLVLILSSTAIAADLTDPEISEAIDQTEDELLQKHKDELLAKAAEIVGEPITQEELKELTNTFGDKVLGVFTFGNILWVTGGIFIFIALFFLGGHYLVSILAQIPSWLYEILIYAACFGAIMGSNFLPLVYQIPTAFIGCIGLIGGVFYTNWLHFGGEGIEVFDIQKSHAAANPKEFGENRKWWAEHFPNIANWALVVVWSLATIHYESQVLGFISVWALMAALGFMAGMAPCCIYLGFEKDAYVLRTTIVSGVLCFFYVLVELLNYNQIPLSEIVAPIYVAFEPGLAFMATFVYYLCLLIVSSKYYSGKDAYRDNGRALGDNFIPLQFLSIGSGIACLYIGSVFGLSTMLGVGGTFFYIYLAEKYFEIPWKGVGWAWSLLIFGAVCYFAGTWALQHPQYFLFG